MSETTQAIEHCPANLRNLCRELEEIAAKIRGNSDAAQNQAQVVQPPVLVLQGAY